MCAEEIQPEARKCKHCGEILDRNLKREQPAAQAMAFTKLVIALAVIAVVVFVAIQVGNDIPN